MAQRKKKRTKKSKKQQKYQTIECFCCGNKLTLERDVVLECDYYSCDICFMQDRLDHTEVQPPGTFLDTVIYAAGSFHGYNIVELDDEMKEEMEKTRQKMDPSGPEISECYFNFNPSNIVSPSDEFLFTIENPIVCREHNNVFISNFGWQPSNVDIPKEAIESIDVDMNEDGFTFNFNLIEEPKTNVIPFKALDKDKLLN